jgi:uncharacterized protein YecT (DUF1311 family)
MRMALSIVLCLWGFTASAACPGQTQIEINDCAATRYGQSDFQLNAVWPQVKGYMDSIGAGAVLLDAQRKWLAYRDATCLAEIAPFAGGSIQPLIWYECLNRVTLARIYELQQLSGQR